MPWTKDTLQSNGERIYEEISEVLSKSNLDAWQKGTILIVIMSRFPEFFELTHKKANEIARFMERWGFDKHLSMFEPEFLLVLNLLLSDDINYAMRSSILIYLF